MSSASRFKNGIAILIALFGLYALAYFFIWRWLPEKVDVPPIDYLPSAGAQPSFIEPRDRIIGALNLLFPFVFIAFYWIFQRQRTPKFVGIAVKVVAIALAILIPYVLLRKASDSAEWWPRFARGQVIVGILLGLTYWLAIRKKWNAWLFRAGATLSALLVPYYLLLWMEFPWGMKEGSCPLLEEILAPSAGAHPAINFTAQYINLLGYPLIPFTKIFPQHSVLIAYLWIDLLKILSLVFTAIFLKKALGRGWTKITIPLVLTLSSISGLAPNYWFNPTSYWAVFPVRLVLPLGLGAFLLHVLERAVSKRREFILGVCIAIVAINNTDWGLPAAGAALLVYALKTRRWVWPLAGTIFSTIFYVLSLRITTGFWPEFNAFFYFARVFTQGGLIVIPMPSLGLHWLVLGTFGATAALGLFGTLYPVKAARATFFPSLIYIGLFAAGTSLYYVNRSLLPVLQSQFWQWSVCISLLTFGAAQLLPRRSIHHLPLALLFGIALTSFVNGPIIREEVERISGANTNKWKASFMVGLESIREPLREKVLPEAGQNIGIFGLFSNSFASEMGVKSVTGFWAPSALPNWSALDRMCWAIRRSNVKKIWVNPVNTAPEVLDMFEKCGMRGDKDARPFFLMKFPPLE